VKKTLALVAIISFSVACQSAADKQAEELKKAAEQTAAAAQQVAKAAEGAASQGAAAGAQDLGKALQGMAAAMSGSKDGKPVEPVSLDALRSALPAISGYEMEKPRSERMTAPFPMAQTEATYKKGDDEIEVKIVDAAFAQLLVMPWKMMMAAGYSKETDDGYEKATTVGGNPAWEKWDKGRKRGEIGMFVGDRFMISVEGDSLSSISQLHDIASKVDVSKLK
jgi:hypothetical protein